MTRLGTARSVRLCCALALCLLARPLAVRAAPLVWISGESQPCDSQISDLRVDGVLFDTYATALAPTLVRCGPLQAPAGSRYFEWPSRQAGTGPEAGGIGPELPLPVPIPVQPGRTYYLGSFWRFERLDDRDVWHDQNDARGEPPYSFDKLIEFTGPGFRWGVSVGWNGEYRVGTDHAFGVDAWYAQSVLGVRGPDHLAADQAGFDRDHPPLLQYGRWYAIVLGVTAENSLAGRVQLWLDGVLILDQPHYTMNPGGYIEHLYLSGTVSQPGYDAPPHLRQADGILVTDDWQEVVAAGLAGGAVPQSSSAGASTWGQVKGSAR